MGFESLEFYGITVRGDLDAVFSFVRWMKLLRRLLLLRSLDFEDGSGLVFTLVKHHGMSISSRHRAKLIRDPNLSPRNSSTSPYHISGTSRP